MFRRLANKIATRILDTVWSNMEAIDARLMEMEDFISDIQDLVAVLKKINDQYTNLYLFGQECKLHIEGLEERVKEMETK